ncbi:hypothetical protein [Pseudomonas tolaasii]|uniref:hypothetical protein n=1 Tax=Pseudomonas tolaasii TaxID=29442 RepID=UPI001C5272BA|nr:hypothetical protein [Pseudomonas tolaasii]QXQ20663.1 hypothetical protein I7845_09660 [Pseudomonas tolaasii]
MNTELTEEEMRRALFGQAEPPVPVPTHQQDIVPEVVVVEPIKATKQKVSKGFTPRLKVTLRVSNDFEGKAFEIVHEADTLSTLLAEQEATKIARKKFRYVEVISVQSM